MTFLTDTTELPEPFRTSLRIHQRAALIQCIINSTSMDEERRESMLKYLVPDEKLREKLLSAKKAEYETVTLDVLVPATTTDKKASWWSRLLAWCTRKGKR